jgi:hypothetical protein
MFGVEEMNSSQVPLECWHLTTELRNGGLQKNLVLIFTAKIKGEAVPAIQNAKFENRDGNYLEAIDVLNYNF